MCLYIQSGKTKVVLFHGHNLQYTLLGLPGCYSVVHFLYSGVFSSRSLFFALHSCMIL